MSGSGTVFAVIDTNVLVSSLFSKNGTSNPSLVMDCIFSGIITPLYNNEILTEYREVLSRDKFHFPSYMVESLISFFTEFGMDSSRVRVPEDLFPDPDDIVFYEVKMGVDDAYLVTGNIRHFPADPFVVTPAQMMEILCKRGLV